MDFFSELDNQHVRLAVKSNVMFAIRDVLQDADIGIPFPQGDIYIKEMHGAINLENSHGMQQEEKEIPATDMPTP